MSLAASFFSPRIPEPKASASQGFGTPNGWITQLAAPRTPAGVQVNEHVAMQVTAVYRAVALISEAVGMLPIGVFRRIEGGAREEVSDHPVARILRNPNPFMTSIDMRSAAQAHALQYGNSYLEIQRTDGGGEILGLWTLLPDRTQVAPREDEAGRAMVYRTVIDGDLVELSPRDVIHIHGLAYDGIRGYSPLWVARNTVGLALALEEFASRFFDNDAKSGGFLEHPGKLSPEAHHRIKESMQAQGGLTNAHRIKILEEGMKYHPITIAPEDAQFLSTRTFEVEEIARLYGIPLHLLQSHSKTTSWGSGIAQMSLGFLRYTLQPWLERWEQELTRKLFTEEELASGYYITHNVNALLEADAEARGRFYTMALNRTTGWMSRNEVRALEDLNPDDVENEDPVAGPLDRSA